MNWQRILNKKPSYYLYKNFRAVVESNKDPLKMGRVKVRILGIHSMDLPAEALPWAEPAWQGGGKKDVGLINVPSEGSWVWVFFDDGDINRPVYFASVHGAESREDDEEFQKENNQKFEPEKPLWGKKGKLNRYYKDPTGKKVVYINGQWIDLTNSNPGNYTINSDSWVQDRIEKWKFGHGERKGETNPEENAWTYVNEDYYDEKDGEKYPIGQQGEVFPASKINPQAEKTHTWSSEKGSRIELDDSDNYERLAIVFVNGSFIEFSNAKEFRGREDKTEGNYLHHIYGKRYEYTEGETYMQFHELKITGAPIHVSGDEYVTIETGGKMWLISYGDGVVLGNVKDDTGNEEWPIVTGKVEGFTPAPVPLKNGTISYNYMTNEVIIDVVPFHLTLKLNGGVRILS